MEHVGGDMHHILTALNIIYSLHRHLNDAADNAPRLDRRTLDDITLRLRQLGQGVKELVDMNERQRRLLGQLDVQPIVDALLGRATELGRHRGGCVSVLAEVSVKKVDDWAWRRDLRVFGAQVNER
ncbi:g8930 [Coccomyxa viridis]|uniref:G8930 protein n=1 Tax=Coccomyxa viridis TaxID=1274662 RepID=A0ABP1G629_9CHLO